VALSTKTNDGTGVGAFTSTLTGLTLNTVYYIRSYATNSVGTSYGPEVSFAFIPTVTSGQGRIWMDRNLGATQAATSSTDAASIVKPDAAAVTSTEEYSLNCCASFQSFEFIACYQ
jgi:hypothetical protein